MLYTVLGSEALFSHSQNLILNTIVIISLFPKWLGELQDRDFSRACLVLVTCFGSACPRHLFRLCSTLRCAALRKFARRIEREKLLSLPRFCPSSFPSVIHSTYRIASGRRGAETQAP